MLDGFNRPLRFAQVTTPRPGPHEVRVRVRALALNPYDRIVQTLGGLITPGLKFPAVLGSDVAGEVVATGEACERVRVGDRVMGLALGMDRVANRLEEGAFQEQVLLREDLCCRLPDSVPFTEAAVLPLALATAASGLFLETQLGLRIPPVVNDAQHHPQPEQGAGSVVVWGGATSVGSVAIQLARASGYRVLSTASPHNHDHVRSQGAAVVEDYRDPSVIDRLTEAARGDRVVGVLAIGVGSGMPCLRLAARQTPRPKVAMASTTVPLDGAPLGPQGTWRLVNLPRLAGGMASLVVRARFRGVATCSIWGTALVEASLGRTMFAEFAEHALVDGRLRPTPTPVVAAASLEGIPDAMETLRRGVSARKVVIQL